MGCVDQSSRHSGIHSTGQKAERFRATALAGVPASILEIGSERRENVDSL